MRTLLYAEDEASDIFLLRHALDKLGLAAALQCVQDGVEAIEYLSRQGKFADRTAYPEPAVLLLDLNLPRVDGFAVLKWVRSTTQYASLPIVVFTSSVRAGDKANAMRLGATEFTVKTGNVGQLETVARRIAEKWLLNEKNPR
jgi:two-component system response regulator